MKTASKEGIGNCRNKKKSPKMGRKRKSLQSKGMEDSPLQELNEVEVSKLSDIEFKRMVTRMFTDNYKELSENYKSMKKEIETINKNRGEINIKSRK